MTNAAHDHNQVQANRQDGVVVIHPEAEILSKQNLPYFVGVSAATTGATGISMNLIVIPPGGRAEPHTHSGYETAIYLLKGRAKTLYGPGLKQEKINVEGDFIFIAANVPHQPINLSDTEPVYAIVARNDANEQEHVVHYDPNAE
jgi:uncharacterized RmlC-like cupin family protein